MKKVTLKLQKGVNSDAVLEEIVNEVVCGDYKFTIKDFMIIPGHDDSLPYYAVLYLNGKPFCRCLNDGWGGETNLEPIKGHTYDELKSINEEIKDYKWAFKNHIFDYSLNFIADILADSEAA